MSIYYVVMDGFSTPFASTIPLAAMSAFYFYLVCHWPIQRPIRSSLKLCYLVVLLLPIPILGAQLDGYYQWLPLTTILSLTALGTLLYASPPHRRIIKTFINTEQVKYAYLHVIVMITYISAMDLWFDDQFGPLATVLLVAHATVILFTTVIERFSAMLKMALAFYLAAAIKILGFDMADFSVIEKIIAFMGIGVLLLVSAYQFQRFRDRYLEITVDG